MEWVACMSKSSVARYERESSNRMGAETMKSRAETMKSGAQVRARSTMRNGERVQAALLSDTAFRL